MEDKEASNLPWVEKYRPRSMGEVAHQEEVIATLQAAVEAGASKGELPHLLLYGPPGTGKTSTALALVRDLFGPSNVKARVLELNASDERGIKVVRDKIKIFAQSSVARIDNSAEPGKYPCPLFKVVVLDEADAITRDAQTALRRTMEAFATVTRFVLICNYVSRVIAPLASRCAKFRFNPLPEQAMLDHLRTIANAENVQVEDQVLKNLVGHCGGDLRKAITTLQSAHRMTGNTKLTDAVVAEVACLIPAQVVDSFDEATSGGAKTNAEVRKVVDNAVYEGYSGAQLLTQYAQRLANPDGMQGVSAMNGLQKAVVALIVAQTEHRLIDGTDEKVQLYDTASRIAKVAAHSDNIEALVEV